MELVTQSNEGSGLGHKLIPASFIRLAWKKKTYNIHRKRNHFPQASCEFAQTGENRAEQGRRLKSVQKCYTPQDRIIDFI